MDANRIIQGDCIAGMTFGSLFAGIGGFDLACDRSGMRCLWQVEIDPQCRSVLGKHFPTVERYTDVKEEADADNLVRPDLICGGFPCQDLSVAGRRAGLAGKRSGLFFDLMRIVERLAPRWLLLENVPGLLSSHEGRDMGTVLRTVGQLGYGWAYRVLDAQWFGVPQRRRRVFIVGCLGDGRRAAEVLFERESLPWDSPPSRGKRLRNPTRATGIDAIPIDMRQASRGERLTNNRSEGNTGGPPGLGIVCEGDPAFTVSSRGQAVAYRTSGNCGVMYQGDRTAAINCGTDPNQTIIHTPYGIRRLTPREEERLQGFPDDWTRYSEDGKQISDSARYRMLGNAVAVPVVQWITKRIAEAELFA